MSAKASSAKASPTKALASPGDGDVRDLIYDWNVESADCPSLPRFEVDDETLRDGLQSPSVREPHLDEKIAILDAMVGLGIRRGDIGLPMSAQREEIRGLLRHIADARLPFAPGLAVRTVVSDIQHVADLQQEVGIPVKAEAFLGSSRLRQMVEGWDLEFVLKTAVRAVEFARAHDVPIMFVTEDTTRTHPDDLHTIYRAAIDAGATEVCIADTVGHSTPWGAKAVVKAVRAVVDECGRPEVLVNWHGHNDRGLAVINSLAAAEAGADVVHASALGIGERSGNTPMDQLLVNMKLLGLWEHDLRGLAKYVELAARVTDMPIPVNYPVFGRDAFRTATGVHAAAIAKALRKGNVELADLIYSGVAAAPFGLCQQVEIGRMSGKSNVLFWLACKHIEGNDALVERILERAHASRSVLAEEELFAIVRDWQAEA